MFSHHITLELKTHIVLRRFTNPLYFDPFKAYSYYVVLWFGWKDLCFSTFLVFYEKNYYRQKCLCFSCKIQHLLKNIPTTPIILNGQLAQHHL